MASLTASIQRSASHCVSFQGSEVEQCFRDVLEKLLHLHEAGPKMKFHTINDESKMDGQDNGERLTS